ncbi:Myotubularin-related protein 2 [Aphelenchoides avenae]|nr:Myotubularin-related protein 2 [Aphelenchus avenae]
MPNRSSYSAALDSEVFKTISSEPDASSLRGRETSRKGAAPYKPPWLHDGEEVHMEEDGVGYQAFDEKVSGRVYVTNFRLRFEHTNRANGTADRSFDLTLGSISRIEKVGYANASRGEDSYGLEITCKDMRNIRFLHRPETHSRRPLYDCLQKYAFPNSNKLPFFATVYKQRYAQDGWTLYDATKEFQRMV